jgi:F-type H+-transporting ATPase subunit a
MPEHELWLTALFNDHLAGLGNSILGLVGMTADNPSRPWQTWILMEILVAATLMILVAMLRPRLSADNPGKLQHSFEAIYLFLKDQASEVGIHHPEKYVAYFGTVFIFLLSLNLIGTIPAFESPTTVMYVPAAMALCTFLYYNAMGLKELGLFKYMAHFAGPVWWLAPFMIPIELISHMARPLSLTVRLYGNMYAGEQITNVFIGLTYLVVPVIFMALHVFVSILQAYVFTLLAMIYVSGATAHEH